MIKRSQRILAISIVIISLAILAGCGGAGQQPQQGPMPVQVMNPVEREVVLWDSYIGRFAAVDRVEIRPRVSGYLEEVHFRDGTLVEKGDLLFTVDRRPFEAALGRAEAEFEVVRTQRNLAEAELDRAKDLLDARAGSREEYEQALQSRDAAIANLQGAEAAVREAALNLEFCEIRAPISGRIGQDLIDNGNLVSAEQTLLTTIVSVDPIYFEFTGTEKDFQRYLELAASGNRESSRNAPNPVRIRITGRDDFGIEGVMDFVDNEIDANTGTILGRARVANPDGLLTPGLFGELRLYGRDPYQAIMIPDTAVQFDQSRQFVWTIGEQGVAIPRFVQLGRLIDEGMRIIESGVTSDDQIIISGLAVLRPGLPVQPITEGQQEAAPPAASGQQ